MNLEITNLDFVEETVSTSKKESKEHNKNISDEKRKDIIEFVEKKHYTLKKAALIFNVSYSTVTKI